MNPTEQQLWREVYVAIISLNQTTAATACNHANRAVQYLRESIERLYHNGSRVGEPE